MGRRIPDLLTVTPPTLDRSGFPRIDRALSNAGPMMPRDWLLSRFHDGLQLRALTAPHLGFVAFTPGRMALVPVLGAEQTVVVHDLRVGAGSDAPGTVRALWGAVEEWARFYGYSAVVAVTGPDFGLVAPERAVGRHYSCLDRTRGNVRLIGRILQGPLAMPRLPQDWAKRAARLGPGLTVQTTGRSGDRDRCAEGLMRRARAAGLTARIDRLTSTAQIVARAVSPAAVFSVAVDGALIASEGLSEHQLWAAICRRLALPASYSPA